MEGPTILVMNHIYIYNRQMLYKSGVLTDMQVKCRWQSTGRKIVYIINGES